MQYDSTGRRNSLPDTSDTKSVYQSPCASRTKAAPPVGSLYLQVHGFFAYVQQNVECGGINKVSDERLLLLLLITYNAINDLP